MATEEARMRLGWAVFATTVAVLAATPVALRAISLPHDSELGVTCNSCHSVHGTLLPKGEELASVCKSCHNPTGMAPTMFAVENHVVGENVVVDCGACHDAHGPHLTADPHPGGGSAPNLSLVRSDPAKYVPGATSLVFQKRPAHFAFGDDASPWVGACQACHQKTGHHSNNALADHHHELGKECTVCHTHKSGFLASGGCTGCHAVPQGQRRQIVGAGGDFERHSTHVGKQVTDDDCAVCHFMGGHTNGTVKVRDPDAGNAVVYSFSPADTGSIESFCLHCHDADGAADGGGLMPFSTGVIPAVVAGKDGAPWTGSAHATMAVPGSPAGLSCYGDGQTNGCHGNAHGSDADKLLAAPQGTSIPQLCFNCHTQGKVQNDAISGGGLADDIKQAFGLGVRHDLGASFTVGGGVFSLQCTTCHNPHVVSGKHQEAGAGVSPVTRPDFSNPVKNPRAVGTMLWGDGAGEKMQDFAGSGTYRTPHGDTLDGGAAPDYVTFCLDCHGPMKEKNGGITWTGDHHGLGSANIPNGGGSVPDWFSAGKADGWDGDTCIDSEDVCWPVMTRGKGEQIWSRPPYNQVERIAGANFVLSCTDCHEAHGSGVSSMLRPALNAWEGSGTVIWNSSCNACHYYYSDWHAGMSCGNASCHQNKRIPGSNSVHGIDKASGASGTRIFDPDLVFHYAFENNLNDSGTWRLHGRWFDGAGTMVAGKAGKAAEFNGDNPVEVGTRNGFWSTDEGYHGTWKYTEMKYNMTLEAWVNPASDVADESIIFAKHTYLDGGYAFLLSKVGGTLRAALLTNMTGGGPTWGDNGWDAVDCNGLRGAYSSVSVPLDRWTHVAATFDHTLPDRNPADPSQGRIRIYVNGEDVTWSDPDVSSCYAQPGPGETTMFPYSMHSPDNEAICYDKHWCASAFSIGGLMWGSGSRKGIVGKVDEAKVWNVTRDAAWFEAVDKVAGPRLDAAYGMVGSDKVEIVFSEGVFAANNGTGALTAAAFSFTDLDGGRKVVAAAHVPGAATATVTLSAPLDASEDLWVDLVAPSAGKVFDEYGVAASTDAAVLLASGVCPNGPTGFALNEPAGSTLIFDNQGVLPGKVSDPAGALPGDGQFHGDGVDNYVLFPYNPGCLHATESMTLELRFRPDLVDSGGVSTIQRLFAADDNSGYQVSVWRNTSDPWGPVFSPPAGVACLAFWVAPVDKHGGNAWKPVLTDYSLCPVVAGHWYKARVVWSSSKQGGIPADVFIDDQGPAGNEVGQSWTGMINCTDWSQKLIPADRKLFPGDVMVAGKGDFAIGANVNNTNNNLFVGRIDWINWSPVATYVGVDGGPLPGP